MKKAFIVVLLLGVGLLVGNRVAPLLGYPSSADSSTQSFVNFESPHVHPLDITPDGKKLLAVNTADNRLEVFDISASVGTPVLLASVPVGLDPVSVRARTNGEAWVVNSISDSISVVNLATFNVIATVQTEDEPADVVFAGVPQRAFVSAAQASKLMVFDAVNRTIPPTVLDINGEEPRAMAVSADGSKVYLAIFDSGNKTTILGSHGAGSAVDRTTGPYGGQNPPPNSGANFVPAINPNLPVPAPNMGLIVKKNAQGRWVDDNIGDWTDFVSGASAGLTGRQIGWDVVDNDVAVIDTATLAVSYITGLMNLNMAIATRPSDGKVTVIGTDALNHIRFEPNLKGRFIRVNMAIGDSASPNTSTIVDLNSHLTYSDAEVATQSDPGTFSQALRDTSIGDPRAIVWNTAGTEAFVAGMGSNNVIVVNSAGARVGSPIPVGRGPTGLALKQNRLYVMNKFDGSISLINTTTKTETGRFTFFDPTPEAIKLGRKFQYDTHATSALGHIACASCHADARLDRLAWDLGNPAGEMTSFGENCNFEVVTKPQDVCTDFHPMKGPMLTQTLQDIIGKEPHHWRGDKTGIEGFNGAFVGLQGREALLTPAEMQQYEDFLATIYFPPNPYRNFDNSLPTSLPLPGHFAVGDFVSSGGLARGAPMPAGNAQLGMTAFMTKFQHGNGPGLSATCRMCHAFPTGGGADVRFVGDVDKYPNPASGVYEPIPAGPLGERHLMTSNVTFAGGNRTFKVPQFRNIYKRVGFERTQVSSRSGFGFFHDGGEGLVSFIARFPNMTGDQEVSDFVAFILSISGSDLPTGGLSNLLEPPGTSSQDSHAAVGEQVTVTRTNRTDAAVIARIAEMTALADAGKVGLVVKGKRAGIQRGYAYLGAGVFQSDKAGETATTNSLRQNTATGSEITFTVVPFGSQTRIGIDRDEDGVFDGDDTQLTITNRIRARTLSPTRSSAPSLSNQRTQSRATSH